ncbi:hypothetical protein ACFR99_12655 [Haloarchaeobius amylolyticus]|uniref:Uncharacterized protein n=1 Tax=Haloarchaeobius amylolyticus TaxID=1198296 RepID=A0ABD6BI84_9EURY
MSNSDDEQSLSERLPDALVEQLDTFEPPELRTVHEYVEQLLEEAHPPIEKQIREEAKGDVLAIEDEEVYTLVKMRSPDTGDSDSDSSPVSLYHVTRERHPDGEEDLNWSLLGDLEE